MDDNQLLKIGELQTEIASLKNSREFRLGTLLRQYWAFKQVRHFRLRDRMVRVSINCGNSPNSLPCETWLTGIWFDDFPSGMPLELLERDIKKWHFYENEQSPYQQGLYTNQKSTFIVYTKDENLRLDFLMQAKSGKIKLDAPGQQKIIDLYSPETATISVFPNRNPIESIVKPHAQMFSQSEATKPAPPSIISRSQFTGEDQEWLSRQAGNPLPLSLNHPDWRGILASAKELFENIYTLPDDLDKDRSFYFARLFQEANCPSITIQGFPKTYYHLIQAIRKISPKLPIYVIYHGNFFHVREDYDWDILQTLKRLHDKGDIAKIGFVKKGMAEIMTAAGMRAAFIMNRVRHIPEAPSCPLPNGFHIGIWGQPDWSWKKPPYAMLASLKLVSNAVGHAFNVSPRAQQFGNLISISARYQNEPVSQTKVLDTLAQMHLNLYVTLTECAPMIPLESLSVGSPCLFGPTSHYFLDHDFLRQRLVVPYPDDAESIARFANKALEERSEIIDAYRVYAPTYNQRAIQVLSEFLEYPLKDA